VATDWKNQKKRDAERSEMVSVRVPAHLKAAAPEIAARPENDSTMAAVVRWGLETFIEKFGKPAEKTGLFD